MSMSFAATATVAVRTISFDESVLLSSLMLSLRAEELHPSSSAAPSVSKQGRLA